MEQLEQLETRVYALLARIDELRAENASLQQADSRRLHELEAENETLRRQLIAEQEKSAAVLERIDSVLLRLKERAEQE